MRARGLAILACLLAASVPALASGAPAKRGEPAPGRVMVRGSEFDLTLSKPRVSPGRVIVQFFNEGEDAHDLRMQRSGGSELAVPEVEPGGYENLDARLRKSSGYVLWCSLDGHREAGMEANLRTKKRRAG